MNKNGAWKTWVVVIGLLIFTGLATATWLWFSSQEDAQTEAQLEEGTSVSEPITISVGDYVLGNELLNIDFISENIEGQELNPWLVVIGATVLVSLLVGGLGFLIMILSVITSRQVAKVYADEDYQTAQSELTKRDAETMKEWRESQPPAQADEPKRSLRGSAVTSAAIFLILVWITGLAFSLALLGDTTFEVAGLEISAVALVNLILVLITLVVMILTFRSREPEELDIGRSDNNPVNWSYVWIVLSGVLIFGLGAGLAIAMSSIPAG